MTNIKCHSILQNNILELTCAQDSHTPYAIIHDMKNIYVMLDKYTIKNNKNSQQSVDNMYVMQGRPIVQEIVIIIHELNLI